MNTPPERSNRPLEATWINWPLVLVVEGRTVTGDARANWGALEVAITSPVANLCRSQDSRGWCFALLADIRPEERFALGGKFTPKGIESATRMLADMYLDWLAVSRHEDEVISAHRLARQELAEIDRSFTARTHPATQERQRLRRALKANELQHRDYQRRLKELTKTRQAMDRERLEAEHTVNARFTTWLEGRCGRRISLVEADRLLRDVALVVEVARQ